MGYVVRLKRSQLVGGSNNDEIYPITATNAVYRGGKNLEEILDEISDNKQLGTLNLTTGEYTVSPYTAPYIYLKPWYQ